MDFLGLDKYVDKYFLEAFSEHVCCKAFKGAVQGDRDPTDALVAKYNQAGLQWVQRGAPWVNLFERVTVSLHESVKESAQEEHLKVSNP